jgi:hypothetical protein
MDPLSPENETAIFSPSTEIDGIPPTGTKLVNVLLPNAFEVDL